MKITEKLLKRIVATNVAFGAYGFYRGFHSEKYTEVYNRDINSYEFKKNMGPPLLISSRIFNGITNGIIYMAPPINLFYLCKMIDRIEIFITKKNPFDYINSYSEAFPYSNYTI